MEKALPHDDEKPKVSIAGDLLELEHNATSLVDGCADKRLLVWNRGNTATDATDLLRVPPTTGPTQEAVVDSINRAFMEKLFMCLASPFLGRIKSFLPTLDEANRKLFSAIETDGAEQFNIEGVTEAAERYVEMDLALGVADLHTPEAVAAAELASKGQVIQIDRRSSCFDDGSESDSDDEEEHSECDMHTVLELIRAQEIQMQTSEAQVEEKERSRTEENRRWLPDIFSVSDSSCTVQNSF